MRYAVMQFLTWATVAGAVVCAVLLAKAGFGPAAHPTMSATSLDQLLPQATPPAGQGVRLPAGRPASSPAAATRR
jgi:hypothetical protein